MWKLGEMIVWRELYRERVWHAKSVFVVRDLPNEIALSIIPGAECAAEEHYARGIKNGRRRWDFKNSDWKLERYSWLENRVLAITEPEKYYSIMLFWNHASNRFLGYYVNFQLPFRPYDDGVESLDLDIDIDIEPNLTFKWKDIDDYQNAINHGLIMPEWVDEIDKAKPEIFDKLEKRQYPFDGSWLDWKPDPSWALPKLPENWDKI